MAIIHHPELLDLQVEPDRDPAEPHDAEGHRLPRDDREEARLPLPIPDCLCR
jgi:hypothetical protein